ncbi:MAG: hypothetical protein ACI82F_004527 [Planctomycetota bacterium]
MTAKATPLDELRALITSVGVCTDDCLHEVRCNDEELRDKGERWIKLHAAFHQAVNEALLERCFAKDRLEESQRQRCELVVAKTQAENQALDMKTIVDRELGWKHRALRERDQAQTQAVEALEKVAELETDLEKAIFGGQLRRCDIPACNCNGYHSHYAQRMTEEADKLAEALLEIARLNDEAEGMCDDAAALGGEASDECNAETPARVEGGTDE